MSSENSSPTKEQLPASSLHSESLHEHPIFSHYSQQQFYKAHLPLLPNVAFVYPTMTMMRCPKSLYGHCACYTQRGEIFLFGGVEPKREKSEDQTTPTLNREYQDAVLMYENQFAPNRIQKGHYSDMGKWHEYSSFHDSESGDEMAKPSERAYATCQYVPQQKVYIYGGEDANKQPLNDMWCFDMRRKQWVIVGNGIAPLSLASSVLYFETTYQDEDTVHRFLTEKPEEGETEKIERLSQVATEYQSFLKDPFRSRYLPDAPNVASSQDEANYHIVLYGGKSTGGKCVNSVYAYSIKEKQWRQLEDGPAARRGHSAVYRKGKMYIFGGYGNDKSFYQDVWEYDVEKALSNEEGCLTKLEVNSSRAPEGRTAHSSLLVGSRMYIFGGHTGKATKNDLWYFDLDTQEWKEVKLSKSLHARWYHTLVYVNERQVALIGGANGGTSKALQNVELIHLPGAEIEIRESRITGEPEMEEDEEGAASGNEDEEGEDWDALLDDPELDLIQ